MEPDTEETRPKPVSDKALGRLFQAVAEEPPPSPLAALVEFEQSDRAPIRLPLPGLYHIGRRADCAIRFSPISDTLVSGLHAELRLSFDGGELRDLGSKNGTFLNNQRLDRPAMLQDGDVVEFGNGGPRIRYFTPKNSMRRLRPSLKDAEVQSKADPSLDSAETPTWPLRVAANKPVESKPNRKPFLILLAIAGATALALAAAHFLSWF